MVLGRWPIKRLIIYIDGTNKIVKNPHRFDALLECLGAELAGSLHCLAVIIWPPGGAVDVDVMYVKRDGFSLHAVRDGAVQHPNACHKHTTSHYYRI